MTGGDGASVLVMNPSELSLRDRLLT